MLTMLSASASSTAQVLTKFLKYCSTHPDGILKYDASAMILKIQSDAPDLNESWA